MPHYIWNTCISCGACVDECAYSAISSGTPIYVIDEELCEDSSACVDVCPVSAIRSFQANNKALASLGSLNSTVSFTKDYGIEVFDSDGNTICDGIANMTRIFATETITGDITIDDPHSVIYSYPSVDKAPIIIPYNMSWMVSNYKFVPYSSTSGPDFDRVTVTIFSWSSQYVSGSMTFAIAGWS